MNALAGLNTVLHLPTVPLNLLSTSLLWPKPTLDFTLLHGLRAKLKAAKTFQLYASEKGQICVGK